MAAREMPDNVNEELQELVRTVLTHSGLPGLQPEECEFRVLRPAEAAQYRALHPKTLEWRRRRGSGPAYVRLGERNAIGYLVVDLNLWCFLRRVEPKKPARRRGRPPKGGGIKRPISAEAPARAEA